MYVFAFCLNPSKTVSSSDIQCCAVVIAICSYWPLHEDYKILACLLVRGCYQLMSMETLPGEQEKPDQVGSDSILFSFYNLLSENRFSNGLASEVKVDY